MSFLSNTFLIVCIFFITSLPKSASQTPNKSSLQTYIVHVEAPDDTLIMSESEELESWYRTILPATTTTSSSGEDEVRLVYSYRHVFKGFAARLLPDQVTEMKKKRGFVSARPQKSMSLHTTHSLNFLGFNPNMGLWKETNYGEGVIIGMLDTGVLPEHPSFSDEGMPPPPAKWKGKCQFNHTTCNNKIIGARYFNADDQTPLDDDGHGTHTVSTAAGRFAHGANLFGITNGTASGVVPLAHLAIYKVCCGEVDTLAGMDAAIEDGVDVFSISIGVPTENLYKDSIAIGAFNAVEKGFFVSCSAGNNGPSPSFVLNGAPWILTVGASTMTQLISNTNIPASVRGYCSK